jgi:two-component system, NtrC family, sensor histidine kinase PilS
MQRAIPLLRWLYLGRLAVAGGIFAGALLVWKNAAPQVTLIATLVLLATLAFTGLSAWLTHTGRVKPGRNFLYLQVVFDALLVTAVVHLTGPARSDFAPLYVIVIAVGAVLLPAPGGMLIAALSSVLYVADIVWQVGEPPTSVLVQIVLFGVMALVTGLLGDRLRRAGVELGAAKRELEQLQLDTSDILATIDTGVVTTDSHGRLVFLNPAGEAILGVSEREWEEVAIWEELDRRAPGLGAILQRTAATRWPVNRFETQLLVNGRERVLGVRTTILERRGTPWVTAVFQDITDRRRLEDLDRRTERLEALAELSASLAHEIKNPLASIRSSVEQLAGGRVAKQDRATLEGLVLKESDRLARLLSDFIDFSRVERERQAPFDLGLLVKEAAELAQRHPTSCSEASIQLSLPESELRLQGDQDLLHRAAFNLILNALQHAGEGGEVTVDLAELTPSELPAGVALERSVRLQVSDTGPGIPPQHLARLFDPFFTTRPDGTGLGLALVHRAVEAHGGAIFVDGRPGRGAVFTVYLPAPAVEPAQLG